MEWLMSKVINQIQTPEEPLFGECPGVYAEGNGPPVLWIGGLGMRGGKFIKRCAKHIQRDIVYIGLPNPFDQARIIRGIQTALELYGHDIPIISFSMGAYYALRCHTELTPRVILLAPLIQLHDPVTIKARQKLGDVSGLAVEYIASYMNFEFLNTFKLISDIKCPVIIIRGELDSITAEYKAEFIASVLYTIPNMGHLPKSRADQDVIFSYVDAALKEKLGCSNH